MLPLSAGQHLECGVAYASHSRTEGLTITADAEVMSVHPITPVTQLRVRVARQTGETVLEGEAWCYTFRPQEGAG